MRKPLELVLAFVFLAPIAGVAEEPIYAVRNTGVVWSGLRLDDRAVVRVFKQGDGKADIQLEPWPGQTLTLPARPEGRTFILASKDGRPTVEKELP